MDFFHTPPSAFTKMGKPAGRSRLRRVKVRRRLRLERLDERRVLAAVTGAVFEDANLSLHRELGELFAPRRLVFIDANQNDRLDAGDPVAITDLEGKFRFEDVRSGTHLVRLFNGSASQTQTVPIAADSGGEVVAVEDALQFATRGSQAIAVTSGSIVIGSLRDGTRESIELGNQIVGMQTLPDGRVLVIGNDWAGPTSWLIDPLTGSAETFELDGVDGQTPWSDLAVDQSGRGVLIEQSQGAAAIRAIDASSPEGSIEVVTTSTEVPADTQAITSDSGVRSVLAWADEDGLQLSLWSNVTASMIDSTTSGLPGALELLDFDDESGLLAVRDIKGGVSIHDVDAGFAPLHRWEEMAGPVAIDGSRELLVTVSPQDAMLKMFSLRDGEMIADLAVDLSAIGPVTSLSLSDPQAIAILGAAGITEIALRRPAAHEVTIVDGENPDPILFGVAVEGENKPPTIVSLPELSTDEDEPLIVTPAELLTGSFDNDGDRFVVVQRSGSSWGTSSVAPDGSITYTPDSDFNGNDAVTILLHDGRSVSQERTLNIQVMSVPDSPQGFVIDVDPIPENLAPGSVIGTIEVIDSDGTDNLDIESLDARIEIQGNEIVFAGGPLDHATDPEISVSVAVTDPETGETIERAVNLKIVDRNEPIVAISPDRAHVLENAVGGLVTFIGVVDSDSEQDHILTVDDERFRIDGKALRLAPGVALDFETEKEVTVRVTATENNRNPNSLTEPITIIVGDIPEQPQSIQLTGDTIPEHVPGASVGEVLIDGVPAASRFDLSVDDPRFEILDGMLKLIDDQYVDYATQSEIELEITARDSQREFDTIRESFLIHVRENDAPQHNHDNPYDVDHSGHVTAIDALAIINYLNVYGPGPVQPSDTGYCYDVNSDAMVTAIDALLVLNEINRLEHGGGTVGTEGEQNPGSQPLAPPPGQPSKTEPPPDSNSSQDDVFGQWASNDDSVKAGASPTAADALELLPTPLELTEPKSDESFTSSVDQTLRLLSEESE